MKTDEKLRSILKNSIDTNKWHSILKNYFNIKNLRKEGPEKMDRMDGVNQGYYHGYIDDGAYQIGLFSYDVQQGDVSRKKIGLRNLVKQYINVRYGKFDAAWVAFYGEKEWRMSFICDIKDVKTDPKRYTYVFGNETALYRTPMDRLLQLKDAKYSFDAFQSAFSVEALSDAFFEGYREKYADFVQSITGKRYVKEGNKYVEKNVGRSNKTLFDLFESDGKRVRDYVKKMMGRLTFLHFLQHKGWMNGDLNYMQGLFNRKSTQYRGRYLSDVLEPLFFGVLNTKESDREKVFQDNRWDLDLLEEWKTIPYLNGGLFEADKEDEIECDFKDTQFRELFDFFSQYNFTIDENDPYDAEVGVDPEMLGKIFENLLEDNNDKGAFYTPKEIVRYMCQESLIAYLNNSTSIAQEKIKKFVQTPEDGINDIPENKRDKLNEALKNVKICDPAIGSGAFPMGLLNLLLRCREAIEQGRVGVSELKKEIIKNNIYGVDIEKGAVDIARLRFWLSIVVDEDTPTPLPNLDYKIMQGNSLLESYKGIDLSKLTQSKDAKKYGKVASLFDAELEKYQKDILLLLSNYYLCNDHQQKQRIQQKIINTVYQLLDTQDDDSLKIDELKRYNICGNDQFFLWHTWFNDVFEKGGFDIVIGNPPYGANIDSLISTYEIIYPQTSHDYKDIYKYFNDFALRICKKNGFLCYIMPNTFLRQPRYGDLRRLLLQKNIIQLLDLGEHIFIDAVVPVAIILVGNNNNEEHEVSFIDLTRVITVENADKVLKEFKFSKIKQLEWRSTINNIFISEIRKVKENELLLGEILEMKDAGFKYQRKGVGLAEKGKSDLPQRLFYKKENTLENKDDIPILIGKDISEFYYSHQPQKILRYNYTMLLKNNESTYYNESIMNAPIKLIWRQTASCFKGTVLRDNLFFGNTIQAGIIKSKYLEKISYEYLCGILNSDYLRSIYDSLVREEGRVFPQVKLEKMKALPIIIPTDNEKNKIEEIVKDIILKKEKEENIDHLKEELNQVVNLLYGV